MQATNGFIENNTVKEAPNRFRCKLPPNKLFKSEKFVRKHILNKQKIALAKIVDKVKKWGRCVERRALQWWWYLATRDSINALFFVWILYIIRPSSQYFWTLFCLTRIVPCLQQCKACKFNALSSCYRVCHFFAVCADRWRPSVFTIHLILEPARILSFLLQVNCWTVPDLRPGIQGIYLYTKRCEKKRKIQALTDYRIVCSKRPRRSPSPVRPPSQNKRVRHDSTSRALLLTYYSLVSRGATDCLCADFRDIDAEVESPMVNRTLVDYSDF